MFQNMGIAIIGCTFVIGALVLVERRKSERINDEQNNKFWGREAHANTVRRKDITFLPYIQIPLEKLPMNSCEDEEVTEYQQTVRTLSGKRVLNLTGYTNTDLKEAYGIANLPQLSEYDENYTTLVNTLAQWGARLLNLGYNEDAVAVLEFGISIGTDVSRNYYMLAQEYVRRGQAARIDSLIEAAQSLDTLMKASIIKKLQDIQAGTLLPPKETS